MEIEIEDLMDMEMFGNYGNEVLDQESKEWFDSCNEINSIIWQSINLRARLGLFFASLGDGNGTSGSGRTSGDGAEAGKTGVIGKVLIDPGHGSPLKKGANIATGAVFGNYFEKDLVLKIAILLENILLDKGYEVELTRRDDATEKDNNIGWRVAMAEGYDILISIHTDAYYDENVRGFSVLWCCNDNSKILAGNISSSNNIFINRGIFERNDLGILKSGIPSALVECGFLTNYYDRRIIIEEPEKIARIIANGIFKYFQE